jgi:hypothetical protein
LVSHSADKVSPTSYDHSKHGDCPQLSPTYQHRDASAQTTMTSPRRSRRRDTVPTVGHSTVQSPTAILSPLANKPAKSILRRHHRQRSKVKNRSSWSENQDSDLEDNACCHSNDVIEVPAAAALRTCSGRPMSLPDAAVLYRDLPQRNLLAVINCAQILPEQTSGNAVSPDSRQNTDETDVRQRTEDDEADDANCEQFRAKKSVSFSEKIFYHSMPPSVSPIESPLCPNRPPLAVNTTLCDDKSKQDVVPRDVTAKDEQQQQQHQQQELTVPQLALSEFDPRLNMFQLQEITSNRYVLYNIVIC